MELFREIAAMFKGLPLGFVVSAVLLLGGSICFGGGLLVLRRYMKKKRCRHLLKGKIINTVYYYRAPSVPGGSGRSRRSGGYAGFGWNDCAPRVSYIYKDQEYRISAAAYLAENRFKIGDEVEVCINPDQPWEFWVPGGKVIDGSWGALLLLAGMGLLFCSFVCLLS